MTNERDSPTSRNQRSDMTTHILSMTYQPKIEGVRRLEVRRTTRIYNEANPFEMGDFALIHGWSGKPYRSPWNWRMPKMPILEPIDMFATASSAAFWQNPLTGKPLSDESCLINRYFWQDPIMDEVARLDGIAPATGIEYQNVLERYHGKFTDKPVRFQVVRW